MKEKISITIEKDILEKIDGYVDNIIIRNRSQAIEFLARNAIGDKRIAVVLSGGNEEDLKIKGLDIFRPLGKIKNETVISKAVKKLRENDFKEIYVIARHKVLTAIFDVLKDGSEFGVKINYIEEKISEGTGDSLKYLKGKLKERALVVYSDIIFDDVNLEDLWNNHLSNKSIATIMLTTSANPSRKGSVRMQGNKIIEFVQKSRADSNLVFSPIFVIEPEVLEKQGHSLEQNIFPSLVHKGLLNGYVSSEKERHVHVKEDLM